MHARVYGCMFIKRHKSAFKHAWSSEMDLEVNSKVLMQMR
jgi:hypothetical protein